MIEPTEEERKQARGWRERRMYERGRSYCDYTTSDVEDAHAHGLAANRETLAEARGLLAACELTGQAMMNERDALREALRNLCDNPNSDYFEMAARTLLNKETL